MLHIKNMSIEDLEFAVQITDTMSWGLARKDFEFMMQLEPEGCFTLFFDSKRIGITTTVSFGKIGWIGNVIVSESYRKKGAGSSLVKHAIKYLTSRNVETVALYAYLDKIPFYTRLGLKYDSEFAVLKGKGLSSTVEANLREIKRTEIQTVIEFDHSCSGLSRKKLLEPILLNQNNLCYVSFEDKQIQGYAAAKVYEGIAELGPLVCRPDCSDFAISLLKATLNRLDGFEVSLCIPKKEVEIPNLLMKSGFKENFQVVRMFTGLNPIKDCIYIAESLERG